MSRKLSPWCKKVKKKLIDLDMTTTELAEVIGLSRGHVSAVVNGRSYSANTVKLISDYLNVPYDCAGRIESAYWSWNKLCCQEAFTAYGRRTEAR